MIEETQSIKNDQDQEEEEEIDLMFCLIHGIGMKINKEKAKQICLKYCEKGHLLALATKYFWGIDCDQDEHRQYELAKEYHEKNKELINKEEKRALKNRLVGHSLHMMAHYFLWIEQNAEEMLEYFNLAVEVSDDASTLCDLGRFYEEEEEDSEKALEYYQRAAEKGHCESYYKLGNFHQEGTGGLEKNIKKALEYYQLAAKYENQAALYNLYTIHERGELVERNTELAANYLLRLVHLQSDLSHPNQFFERNLIEFLSKREVEWREDYHRFWNCSQQLTHSIVCLLLISKHRKEMKGAVGSVFVKGVTREIIKYLCNFSEPTQISLDEEETSSD